MTVPAIIAGGAALAGGVLGYAGQSSANQVNREIAEKQMRFQREMSSTAYQRAVKDMRAAGLNPALAYMQGGASSPGGASTHVESATRSLAEGVSSAGGVAFEAMSRKATVDQLKAQTENVNAQTRQLNLESALRVARIQSEIGTMATQNRFTNARRSGQLIDNKFAGRSLDDRLRSVRFGSEMSRLDRDFLTHTLAERVAAVGLHNRLTAVNARNAGTAGRLMSLELPGAANRANAEGSWWKRNVSPYANDARSVLDFLDRISRFSRSY